jgi:hypothetical protein
VHTRGLATKFRGCQSVYEPGRQHNALRSASDRHESRSTTAACNNTPEIVQRVVQSGANTLQRVPRTFFESSNSFHVAQKCSYQRREGREADDGQEISIRRIEEALDGLDGHFRLSSITTQRPESTLSNKDIPFTQDIVLALLGISSVGTTVTT